MVNLMKCRLDLEGKWKETSQEFCNVLGYKQKELIKLTLTDVIHKKDQGNIDDFFNNIREENYPEWEAETELDTKNGESIPVHLTLMPVRNKEGEPAEVLCHTYNLSTQKELHKKWHTSKQQFESLFNYNPLPVYYYDLEGNFRDANEKLAEFTGLSRDELIGMNFNNFIQGKNLERAKEQFQKATEGEASQYEIEVVVKDGIKRDIRVTKFPMYMADEITGVYGIFEDISDQKKREKALQDSELRFRSMFENNPHSVLYFDKGGTFLEANKKFEELSGYSENELKEKTFAPFVHPDDLEKTQTHFEKALNGEIQKYEITGITRAGDERQVHITNFPYLRGDEIIGVFAICQDITDQKRIERNLQESEQLFRSLFSHNPYPVMRFDLEGNFMDVNNKTVEMAGYSKDKLLESGFSSFIAEEDFEDVAKRFEKAASGEAQYYEVKGHTKNEVLDLEVTLSPIYVKGEIIGLFCIAKDITQQKKAEQKLKESEQRWQQLVEYNPQPVLITQDGKIVFINQVGAEYFGASSAKKVIGKSVLDFSHPESLQMAKKRKSKLEQNEHLGPQEFKIIRLDGEERYVESHSIPITYKQKSAIQTVIHDISDLKEKQHIISKSLKEKETLLQEIHHRVKNNLAVISGLLELQQMNITDEETIHALKDSQLRIQSMAMIHEKLYQSESLHNIGFDAYLKELISSINSTYTSTYKKVSTEFNLTQVTLDLEQAIPCSLIVNEVIVNCYKHAFDKNAEGKINISLEYKDSEVTLEITDNGKGLPADFDISEQQSLGTTLIYALSQQIRGEMILRNREQVNGTKFKLHFKSDNSNS